MKIMKKILSGIMALTMAASMMSATALQAGAETKSDGSHEISLNANVEKFAGLFPYNSFIIQIFDSKEYKLFEKADAKGYVSASFKYYKDEKNYLQIDCKYDNKKWTFIDICENNTSIAKEASVIISEGTSGTDHRLVFYTMLGDSKFNKYKNGSYKYWSIVAYDDKDNTLGEYSLGINVPAKGSKTLAGIETITDVASDSAAETPADTAKENDISSLEISKIKNQTYTGKDRKPAVTVKDGDKTLEKDKDYTVSYKNCKKIGTATVTIKGKGDYTGEKTIEYKIVPKKTALKVTKNSDKKATFKWNKVSGAEKYEIYYSTDGGKKYKKLATVSGSKTSYTNSKLDFKKYDYKFKIRSYGTSGETKYYSSYSSVKTVK